MVLRYSLSKEDYFMFNKYTTEHPVMKAAQLPVASKLWVIWALWTFVPYYFFKTIFNLLLPTILFASFFLSIKLIRNFEYAHVKEVVNEKVIGTIASENELILDEGSIREKFGHGLFEIKYDAVFRVVAAADFFYLYTGPISAVIVPFSAFGDEFSKQEFLTLLRERCKSCEFILKGGAE